VKKMIAYCGMVCTDCGAYIATKNNDDAKRKETAVQWKKQFNVDIKPGDIYCDGCLSKKGKVFNYCTVCEVRKCGREKKVVNCAYCPDYVCEKLGKFFQRAPGAKTNLDEIKKGLK
jgi:hypothetical protein